MRTTISLARCLWVAVLCLLAPFSFAQNCAPAVAKIITVQGHVEVRPSGARSWKTARIDDALCAGQQIRVLRTSRAVLLLTNQTLLHLDEGTVLTLSSVHVEKPSWIELLKGFLHVISRVPQSLGIKTPYVNASVEGTEFALQTGNAETALWVYEGRVQFSNTFGQLMIASGEAAAAAPGRAPERRIVVKPRRAVEWALYYPPLLDTRPEHYPEALRGALAAYRQNDLPAAFARLDALPPKDRMGRFFTLRAGLLLSVGRVAEAERDIAAALTDKGTALALRAVIAVVRNETEEALRLAQEAVTAEPRSPTPYVARSYAEQSAFEIEKAQQSIQQASRLAPDDALVWARLAEIELSLGDLDAALEAARKAEQLDPRLSRTQSVLGFAYLTRIAVDRAETAFEQAITLDPADPLPRLGLGLAKIRDGDVDAGTKEIETAASLDPNNSLVRSYLGKAYYEQKRGGLAETELEQAKLLDPKDPTPWFYSAIHKQTTNRPVEALHDLQRSIDLNDSRAVYRSRLLLDEDIAARSANLARIYDDLGFQQQARVTAWKSVTADPSSFSAHRFLADSYSALPRHEIARVSELLQSQLFQPLNVTPLQSELAVANLAILQGAGPSSTSFYEFNPLFTRNGTALQTNVLYGNNQTVADDFVVSGIHDRFSGSLGQFHYETDGFRPNNDFESNVYSAFGQVAVTPHLSLQAELRRSEQEAGDVDLTLHEVDPSKRQEIDQDSARIGAHYQPALHHHLIASFIYSDSDNYGQQDVNIDLDLANDITFIVESPIRSYAAEIQHLFGGERFKTIAGIGYDRTRNGIRKSERALPGTPPDELFPPTSTVDHREDIYGYLYAPFSLGSTATLTLGLSYDSFHSFHIDRHALNPKFGLVWDILPSTTLRAAAFRVLKRFFVTNQTLEPTQLAGFNQFFDDDDGTDSSRYGVGLDQRFSRDLFGGFELSWRDLTRVYSDRIAEDQDERLYRTYLQWAPHPSFALGAEYQFEEFERGQVSFFGETVYRGLPKLQTHYVPLNVSYYHPTGVFAKFGATYVDQEAPVEPSSSHDRFWTVDAAIGYRLPKRYGLLSLDIKNLFDEEFTYQNSFNAGAQQIPRFQPSRAVFVRINLWMF